VDLTADKVDSISYLANWPLVCLLHQQLHHKIYLLSPIRTLPHEDIIKLHVGSKCEAPTLHKSLNQYPHQLMVILPHDILKKLVILQIVHKGYLLMQGIIENTELWLDGYSLQLLESPSQKAHPQLAIRNMGYPHFLWPP